MSVDRLAPWELAALKTATGHLVHGLGGFDGAEIVSGRARSRLHAYTDVRGTDHAPIDVIARMERVHVDQGGMPIVSALLLRQAGWMAVPVPRAEGEISAGCAQVLREAAELAATHLEAAADGQVSDAERAALAAQLDDVITAATRLRGILAGPALPLGGARPSHHQDQTSAGGGTVAHLPLRAAGGR